MKVAEPNLPRALREQQLRLVEEFRGRVDGAIVRNQFDQIAAGMGDARVKLYLPVLAYRLTRDRLRGRSRAPGPPARRTDDDLTSLPRRSAIIR